MSTAATQIQTLINMYVEGHADKYEARPENVGTYQAFKDDTDLIDQGEGIIGEVERANVEQGGYSANGTSIPVIQGKNYTINTSSYTTCIATQTANDTALLPVTYNTLSTELFIPITDYDYNYVGWGQGLGKALKNIAKDLSVELNTICNTALETNKNQVQTGYLMGGFFADSGTNEFNVAEADKSNMYNYITNQYALMDYDASMLRVIGNPEHFAGTINPSFAQGTGNATNLNYQFQRNMPEREQVTDPFGQFKFYADSKLANGALVNETSFVFPAGSVALIPSIEQKYITGQDKLPERSNVELFTSELPFLPGVEWGFRVTDACTAGVDGVSWQIESRFATITPYVPNLATDLSPINKYQVV